MPLFDRSLTDSPNPVPKPPRGHFVPENDVVSTPVTPDTPTPEQLAIKRSSLDLKLEKTSDFNLTSSKEPRDDKKENMAPLPMFTIPPPPLDTPPVEQATPVASPQGKIIVDLDAPSIDTVCKKLIF